MADSLLHFGSIPANFRDLVGQVFIDQQHRIFAVVGEALYYDYEGWKDETTRLLPVLAIPRTYGVYQEHEILSLVPELIDQFERSGGFEAVRQLGSHRGTEDERLWSIPVPEGTTLRYIHPGRIWRLLTSEDFLDGHFVYVGKTPGNYIPARLILEEAAKIDAYASIMLDNRGFAREVELRRPEVPAAEGGLHFVYRLYDAQDRLLYIGVTGNPKKRMQQHAREKKWWGEVSRTAVQCFDTREESEAAEAEAIASEGPVYNRRNLTEEQRVALAARVKKTSGGSVRAAELLIEKDLIIDHLRAQVRELASLASDNDAFPGIVKETLSNHPDEIPDSLATEIVAEVSNEITRLDVYTGKEAPVDVWPRGSLPAGLRPPKSVLAGALC